MLARPATVERPIDVKTCAPSGLHAGSPPSCPRCPWPDGLGTTRVPRIAGRTSGRTALVTTCPFRATHHPISIVGLVGGGQIPLPGEVSRAHHDMRLLDARPACRCLVLEVLRQLPEKGVIYLQSRGHPRPSGLGRSRRAYVPGYWVALDAQHPCVAGRAQGDCPPGSRAIHTDFTGDIGKKIPLDTIGQPPYAYAILPLGECRSSLPATSGTGGGSMTQGRTFLFSAPPALPGLPQRSQFLVRPQLLTRA